MDDLLELTSRVEQTHFWFRGFRRFVGRALHDALGERRDLRVLDCGCGTGANVELLGRYGRAYGFDLSPAGLRIGHDTGRTRLARASVAAVPFPTGAFDVVTITRQGNVLTRKAKNRGTEVETATYTVSADGKTLTVVTKGNNYGVEYGSTQVFEKK